MSEEKSGEGELEAAIRDLGKVSAQLHKEQTRGREMEREIQRLKWQVEDVDKALGGALGQVRDRDEVITALKEKSEREEIFKRPELKINMLTPDEVKFRLAELVDDAPILLTFVTLIKSQYEVEVGAMLAPNQANESRQYNAGRAAAVADMLHVIGQCREEGRARMEEEGRGRNA